MPAGCAGVITGAAILGRIGDPTRFASLAAVRSFSGLAPGLDSCWRSGRHGGPTKRGDALLREALYIAADHARRTDPQLAAKYHRLMVDAGKDHTSAVCHIAATLLTRIVACQRTGQPYVLRDVDGTHVTAEQAPRDHRRALHRPRRPTSPTPNTDHGDGPAKSEVAKRSIDRPVHDERYDSRNRVNTLDIG